MLYTCVHLAWDVVSNWTNRRTLSRIEGPQKSYIAFQSGPSVHTSKNSGKKYPWKLCRLVLLSLHRDRTNPPIQQVKHITTYVQDDSNAGVGLFRQEWTCFPGISLSKVPVPWKTVASLFTPCCVKSCAKVVHRESPKRWDHGMA